VSDKPNFATWNQHLLAELTHELWDENVKLRTANEQLRLDNKDLSRLLREANTNKDDWK